LSSSSSGGDRNKADAASERSLKFVRDHENRLAALNEVGSLRRDRRRLLRSNQAQVIEEFAGGDSLIGMRSHTHISKAGGRVSTGSAGLGSAGGKEDALTPEDHESHAAVDGHPKDMRKKESLASKFNSLGGNNVMWSHSITFLHHLGVLDFESVLQYYAPKERMPCVLLSSVFSKGAGSKKRDPFSAMLDNMRISLQNAYNHECGVLLCPEGEEDP